LGKGGFQRGKSGFWSGGRVVSGFQGGRYERIGE